MNRSLSGFVLCCVFVVALTLVGCRSMQFPWQNPKDPSAVSAGLAKQEADANLTQESPAVETAAPYSAMESPVAAASGSQRGAPIGGTAPQLMLSGVVPNSGPVRIAVFSSANGFPKHDSAVKKLALDSSAAELTCPIELQSQTFAVAAFQDVNNDGVLNRSSFGIPTEPYGFSRNAQGQMGPPAFEDAAVSGVSKVDLHLRKLAL